MAENVQNESVVVWEWMNDFGHWKAYESSVVEFIEKKKYSCPHVFLGEADRTLSNYVLDTRKMEQIRVDSGTCRSVRRKVFPPQSPPAIGISWQWWGDHREWHHYDFDVASLLEDAHKNKNKTIDLEKTIYSLPYTVDLMAMVQRRNGTGYPRPVQRMNYPRYPADKTVTMDANCASVHLGADLNRKHGLSDSSIESGKNSQATKSKPSKKKNRSTVAPKDPRPPSSRNLTRTFLSKSRSSDSVSATLSQAPFMPINEYEKSPCPPVTVPVNQVKGSVIISPVMTDSNGATTVLKVYTVEIQDPNTDDDCCICCEQLQASAGFAQNMTDTVVLKLNKCDHMFHKSCLIAMYDSGMKDGHLQCPTCKTIYGEKFGNCPAGRMEINTIPDALPGESCNTIRIVYHISSGIQQANHPHPGRPFTARGFPRMCYLPNTEKGRKVMLLLKIAWERRLTFTIGASTTTGEQDTVTWNEIHHKTEFGTRSTGHGYPDPNYLDNVLAELAVQGVTP
ncbi:E3 ubiquitin-protein ligase DTX1-like isoform X2 [Lineus longissimus]|uniref:E3 ubiquitin-protein ligase DTX1-like isoform X2 n=1 Tax=Lineus longissimus TaxID=88925 RepID=UPI00315CC5CF